MENMEERRHMEGRFNTQPVTGKKTGHCGVLQFNLSSNLSGMLFCHFSIFTIRLFY